MKKKRIVLLTVIVCLLATMVGCGNKKDDDNKKNELPANVQIIGEQKKPANTSDVDVDLTVLSSTMVYSQVYNMLSQPDQYIGKTIRAKGFFAVYTNSFDTTVYPAIIIPDATACCLQGLEFVLAGNPQYPVGYPKDEEEIVIKGTFETYEEEGLLFCHLVEAVIE